MSRTFELTLDEVVTSMFPKFRVAVASVLVPLLAAVSAMAVFPQAVDTIARIVMAALFLSPLPAALGLAWSWQRPLLAWLFASSIAPTYLLLLVLFELANFLGWFVIAFIVISLLGVLLAGIGALLGRIALRRTARGDA